MLDRTPFRLHHIVDAISHIEELFQDKSLDMLRSDPFLRAAYERFLEIISEASRHIPAKSKERFPDVPWRKIADIGNRLRHGYDNIDLAILWDIYDKGELNVLRAAANRMLDKTVPD